MIFPVVKDGQFTMVIKVVRKGAVFGWLLRWVKRGSFGWLLRWLKRGSFWVITTVVKKGQFMGC